MIPVIVPAIAGAMRRDEQSTPSRVYSRVYSWNDELGFDPTCDCDHCVEAQERYRLDKEKNSK